MTTALRFKKSDSVFAKVSDRWEAGTVLDTNVEGMAYRIRLIELGKDVYAPRDTEWFVRKSPPSRTEESKRAEQTGVTRRFKIDVRYTSSN